MIHWLFGDPLVGILTTVSFFTFLIIGHYIRKKELLGTTRIKLLCAFLLILTTAFLELHALAVLFTILVASAVLKKVELKRLGYPMFIALVVAGVQMYDSGILPAVLIFLRIFDSVLVLNILISDVQVQEIAESLKGFVPSAMLDIAKLMFKYISIFEEEASTIYKAQWARGGYSGSLVKKAKTYGILGGMLIIRSLDRALVVHRAMRSRGYNED